MLPNKLMCPMKWTWKWKTAEKFRRKWLLVKNALCKGGTVEKLREK
jgi:hypothetical protein